ncbi:MULTISPECIES: TrmB family transcriptional regulator [Cupriavidus]|uniref:Transcriptional regulator TrmB n=1 Tax=Cupriavidus pinatubonensis (strain JMP 134 / LMG 1197) TaxID=264198 RepID=Q470V7_CUPPJ|nr:MULTISPECIES: TrmB family transcriptional regulator [Cupriavidus]QYY33246.1 TrmB family transcriptional regulator [Cupriavidus pinatubonensis]TPQ36862.1 TrmB family transcriptional regulator [Cupriavidus pinatubonensis]
MTADAELIASMTRLGFTQYEAQAYTALVGQAPLTGAEVGRRASMPASKVYETLARLETRGAVLVHRSEPVRYAAVPHTALLAELRSRFNADLDAAASALDRLPVQQEPGMVWSLSGRESILLAFARTISNAKASLFAGIWDEELDELGPLLDAASARGIDTHVAIYGHKALKGPHTYDMAACGASARLRLSGRRLAVVVADEDDAVVAEFGDYTSDQATVTTNPVIALLAVEYIKADVSGRLMISAMSSTAYKKLLTTPPMQAMLSPVATKPAKTIR